MGYVDTLNDKQKKNIAIIVKRLNAKGITNPYSQAGILAVVSKESGFVPQTEGSYRNTSNSRIRSIFGTRVALLSDAQLTKLKQDDVAFFDQVYGPQNKSLGLGNTDPGDGYKYRGRGFNQITGKYGYQKASDRTGIDFVKNPDLLNQPAEAADVLIEFFKNRFNASDNKLSLYNSKGINDFKTLKDSTNAFYHANAGWGKSMDGDSTGGKSKAFERVDSLYSYVLTVTGETFDFLKKNALITTLISAAVIVTGYVLYKKITEK